MRADDPNVGTVLSELTTQSLREMNAARRYAEMPEIKRRRISHIKRPEGMITALELSEVLGITRTNISYYCAAKKLPHVKVGKFVYFNKDEARAAYEALDRTKGRRRN